MADVVDFRLPPSDSDLQWRCCCGCETFYARCDNVLLRQNFDRAKHFGPVADELVCDHAAVGADEHGRACRPHHGIEHGGCTPQHAEHRPRDRRRDHLPPEQFDWTDRHITLARDLIMKDLPE